MSSVLRNSFYSVLWVFDFLKQWCVLDLVNSFKLSEDSTALLLEVKKTRYGTEWISVHRKSKQSFYVVCNSYHKRFINAKSTAKAVKELVYKIKFN